MEEKKKTDRRIRKTETAIFSALISLLAEKPLSEISIRELTERGDIHRATFYDHYTDINACFEALQASVLDEFNAVLKSSPELNHLLIYSNILSYLESNQERYRVLLGKNGSSDFQSRLAALIEEDYLGNIRQEYPGLKTDESWDYLAAYHTGGSTSMISRWIEKGCVMPKEVMCKLLLAADQQLDTLYGIKKSKK